MPPPEPIPAAELLAESAWLERLARRLVAEPAAAADAAQETLTKALVRAPGAGVPLRRWLGAILRNVVRQERRTDRRRAHREATRAEPERVAEPADELAARLELHARLVAAVRSLEEPYRTTVALRFLEDLAPKDVAERMGVPLKTVHTRLERALEHLRARLDRDYGRREAWLALLLPHFGLPPLTLPDPTPLVPLVAMGTLWKWTGAAAALATLGFVAFRSVSSPTQRGSPLHAPVAAQEPAPLAPPPPASAPLPAPEPGREVIRSEPGLPEPVAAAVAPPPLAGFVRDVEQRPIAGLEVGYERAELAPGRLSEGTVPTETAESASDGRFELPQIGVLCRIVARGRGYATLVAPTLMDAPPPEPPVVYVGPERTYAGRVVDAEDKGVSGAELTLRLDESLGQTLGRGTLTAILSTARARSGVDGAFAFPLVGGAPGSTLEAVADGFDAAWIVLPDESDDALVVRLELPDRSKALAGHVRRADGEPAASAHVSTGEGTVRADADGAFALELDEGDEPERLRAVLPGFLPAEVELARLPPAARQSLELVLGPRALTLGGRVEDAQGRAVPAARVWTPDGEPFGKVPTQIGELKLYVGFSLEAMIAGTEDQAGGREVTADAEGRFELTGLLERSYTLYAIDARTNELAGPIVAQAGVASAVLRLAGEPRARVAGRVLSLSGEPQASVQVSAHRSVRQPDGAGRSHARGDAPVCTTDSEGRFQFSELCVGGTELSVKRLGSSVNASFDLAREPDLAALELRVPAPCHLRVVLDDPRRADGLELHDERDQPLDLTFQIGGAYLTSQAVFVGQGLSDLLMTDERARTLVLWKDGQESERIPLHLVPGQVNEVRP